MKWMRQLKNFIKQRKTKKKTMAYHYNDMNPVSWTKQKRGFCMSKLSYEERINLYYDRKN